MTTQAAPARERRPVLRGAGGEPIRGAWIKTRLWALGVAFVIAVPLIAGVYFALWEVHWTFGFLHVDWSLKAWWHAGSWWPSWLGHWPMYRHLSFRDNLEPGWGTLIALTVIVTRPGLWDVRLRPVRLAVTMLFVMAAAIALTTLGVWLGNFGLPDAWAQAATAAGHPGYNWDGAFAWAGKASLFILAWGFGVGMVLHLVWAPAGATIQGTVVDWLADQAHARGQLPWWVRHEWAPPPLIDYFCRRYRTSTDTEADRVPAAVKWALVLFLGTCLLLVALGLMGRYWVGMLHHTVPYLAPGK